MVRKRNYSKKKQNSPLIRLAIFVGAVIFIFFTFGLITTDFSSIFVENSEDIVANHDNSFIDELAPHAVELQNEYGVLPSVTIAQGILESDWGRSGLAQNENNYYGIKGGQGSNQYVTKEFTGEWIETEEPFKSYNSLEDSMEDYAQLLVYGTAWDENHYQQVINANNYVEAANALQQTGYATDPNYSEKIISLVENYGLYEFD